MKSADVIGFVGVESLLGKDIRGLRANVVHPELQHLYETNPGDMIRTLIRCVRHRDGWVYLYWEPEQRADGRADCGYGGWAPQALGERGVIEILGNS